MNKLHYFIVSSHAKIGSACFLRLAVERDEYDKLIGHYFEYGEAGADSLSLLDSNWSPDPDALVGQMPLSRQFHASMDIRQFLRDDFDDALNGSLMSDDVEVIGAAHRPPTVTALHMQADQDPTYPVG